MRRHRSLQPRSRTNPLHHTRDKRRTVQLTHLLRHGNVPVHQGFIVRDHVLVGLGAGLLDRVCGFLE